MGIVLVMVTVLPPASVENIVVCMLVVMVECILWELCTECCESVLWVDMLDCVVAPPPPALVLVPVSPLLVPGFELVPPPPLLVDVGGVEDEDVGGGVDV